MVLDRPSTCVVQRALMEATLGCSYHQSRVLHKHNAGVFIKGHRRQPATAWGASPPAHAAPAGLWRGGRGRWGDVAPPGAPGGTSALLPHTPTTRHTTSPGHAVVARSICVAMVIDAVVQNSAEGCTTWYATACTNCHTCTHPSTHLCRQLHRRQVDQRCHLVDLHLPLLARGAATHKLHDAESTCVVVARRPPALRLVSSPPCRPLRQLVHRHPGKAGRVGSPSRAGTRVLIVKLTP